MKLQHFVRCFTILIFASTLYGQDRQMGRLIFPLLPMEYQSNVVVTADPDHSIPCPIEYTNLLSNRTLFSAAEQGKLVEVTLKYKDVTTNSGPAGSVLTGLALRQREARQLTGTSTWAEITNTFYIVSYAYTNSGANEELAVFSGKEIDARFRTQSGDGYDVLLFNGQIVKYQEYKNGLLDGLFVEIYDPNNLGDREHCTSWARFTHGKILGKYIVWEDGQIQVMAEFRRPFDFLKYQTEKQDLSWAVVSTNATGSTQNLK